MLVLSELSVAVGDGAGVVVSVSSGRPMIPIPVVVAGDDAVSESDVSVVVDGSRIPPITSPMPSRRPPEEVVVVLEDVSVVSVVLTSICLFTTLGK